ncbi:hypothetical protein [Polaribacter aestuariivivens]|uniref:hypothetical protein n=1 Tax=Polaribacter aestuariivivens TaxID=2304626 RepID=UPI003F4983FB
MKATTKTYKNKAVSTIKKGTEKAINAASTGAKIVANNPVKATYVIGGILGFYLLYKVITKTTDKVDSLLEGDPNIDNKISGTGSGSVKNATITNAEALNLANQLLDAMNVKQPLYGTDEETIEKVFTKIKNADDFLKVYHAFGLKDYNGNNSPPTGIWSNVDSYKKQDLVYWLRSEIGNGFFASASEIRAYNKIKPLVQLAGFVF